MKRRTVIVGIISVILLCIVVVLGVGLYKRNENIKAYNTALSKVDSNDFDGAIKSLEGIKFEDSEQLLKYAMANKFIDGKDYESAIPILIELNDYKESAELLQLAEYGLAMQYIDGEK